MFRCACACMPQHTYTIVHARWPRKTDQSCAPATQSNSDECTQQSSFPGGLCKMMMEQCSKVFFIRFFHILFFLIALSRSGSLVLVFRSDLAQIMFHRAFLWSFAHVASSRQGHNDAAHMNLLRASILASAWRSARTFTSSDVEVPRVLFSRIGQTCQGPGVQTDPSECVPALLAYKGGDAGAYATTRRDDGTRGRPHAHAISYHTIIPYHTTSYHIISCAVLSCHTQTMTMTMIVTMTLTTRNENNNENDKDHDNDNDNHKTRQSKVILTKQNRTEHMIFVEQILLEVSFVVFCVIVLSSVGSV